MEGTVLRTDAADATSQPADARKLVWKEGVETLQRITGQSKDPARTFVGKLLKEANNDHRAVLNAIRECPDTGDPKSWLMGAAKARGKPEIKNGALALIARDGIGSARPTPGKDHFLEIQA